MIGIKKVSGGALEVSGAFLFHLNWIEKTDISNLND
jgi:hypothetical protein